MGSCVTCINTPESSEIPLDPRRMKDLSNN